MLSKICRAAWFLCVAAIFLVLEGCATASKPVEPSFYGNSSITRMSVKRYLATHRYVIDRLSINGVQVIQTGDDLMLVLPSDQFFVESTPILNTSYYPVLSDIASLLKDHEKFSVRIAGYTDRLGWQPRNVALSRQQAEAVADYLWQQGIDTRLVYTVGYGARDAIANNVTEQGRAMNRRVEITLRWVTDPRQG